MEVLSVEAATTPGPGQTQEDKLGKSYQLGDSLWGSGTQISKVMLLSLKSHAEARPLSHTACGNHCCYWMEVAAR